MAVLGSVLQILEPHIIPNAAYNSIERQQEEASTCLPGTRKTILRTIQGWINGEGPPILWLHGPAGTGKSTIAQTIAEQCDKKKKNLAFSYFFSRRNTNRNDLTKFITTFACQLVCMIPSLDKLVQKAIRSNPFILSSHLEDQVKEFIVKPLKVVPEQIPSMVVVIDGLDEYSDATSNLPLKDLVTFLSECWQACISEFSLQVGQSLI